MTTRLCKAKAIQLLVFHFPPENIPQESKVQLTCYRDSSRKNHWACSGDYRSQSRLHGRQFSVCQYSERSRHLFLFQIRYPGSRSSLSLSHGESTGDELTSKIKRNETERTKWLERRFRPSYFRFSFVFVLFKELLVIQVHKQILTPQWGSLNLVRKATKSIDLELTLQALLDTLFHWRYVFFCLSMARPLINSLILKTSCKIYVQGKSSVQPPGGEVGMRAEVGGGVRTWVLDLYLGIDEPLKV